MNIFKVIHWGAVVGWILLTGVLFLLALHAISMNSTLKLVTIVAWLVVGTLYVVYCRLKQAETSRPSNQIMLPVRIDLEKFE